MAKPLVTDDEIISLIGFLRGSPKFPYADANASSILATTVQGTWPVSRISRIGAGAIAVDLLRTENSGQHVVLRRADLGWAVTGLTFWISG